MKAIILVAIFSFTTIFPWAEEPNMVRMPKAGVTYLRKK